KRSENAGSVRQRVVVAYLRRIDRLAAATRLWRPAPPNAVGVVRLACRPRPGFVGLASFLNIFFFDQYGLTRVQAGNFATLCVIAGSFLRPVGGYLADRFGGIRVLTLLFVGVGVLMLGMTALPVLTLGTLIIFFGMA